MKYDFSGWATKPDVRCSDGRVIMKDAFAHNDGKKVPLIWNHHHEGVDSVLGHALLKSKDGGIYAYCKLNDTESGRAAKKIVQHGDVDALSIFANKLTQKMSNVHHGEIRELSLVLAGANPEAFIDSVLMHNESYCEDVVVYLSNDISLEHGEIDEEEVKDEDETLEHKDEPSKEEPAKDESSKDDNRTVGDVLDTLNEEQATVVYALLEEANKNNSEENEGGNDTMKHNVFDNAETKQKNTFSHADQQAIVALAKQSNVGSFKLAMEAYIEENGLAHSDTEGDSLAHGIFETFDTLLPEYELLKKGAPETLERDQSWVAGVLSKIHKSPVSRIRTRQADARIAELRAKGYQNKGDEKVVGAKIKQIARTTDPQTIYIKEDMHRDDIVDITDFDVVAYQWNLMRHVLNEELALAALVGDGRDDSDPDKIHETHVRSVWNDEELYTIHADVDITAAKAELQGTNTAANFGENYIYAEAIITAALYAREKYKGTGTPDLYCTPHMVNVMLLARDLNGRRIYDSKADLAAALNVGAIHTVEQFEGKIRTTEDGDQKKLLGLFVNMADYQFGCTKGGEITKFEDFDMDFNKYKYMLETRLSGSLTKLFAAIALEEPVVAG